MAIRFHHLWMIYIWAKYVFQEKQKQIKKFINDGRVRKVFFRPIFFVVRVKFLSKGVDYHIDDDNDKDWPLKI